jgi:short-subunit dehydrogenase
MYIVITDASKLIGRAAALAEQDWSVIVVARS